MAKKTSKFPEVVPVPNFHQLEEDVLTFWKENKIFEKSIEQRSVKNAYIFYDGPPFVTGTPHYGHLTGSVAKDLIPRYQTMKGKRVRRVWGWDCHGLPIENKVEAKLGIKNRREIEKFGINKFIDECRSYVEKTSSEWGWYVEHIGRWVDFEHAYRTMDLPYMESVIWVFKQLYDKGLVYEGKRVSLFCTRCGTPISNFEIAMDNSYETMKDPSVTVKFKLKEEPVYVLAWTTTPWTLPANLALAVAPDKKYLKIKRKEDNQVYILAQERVKKYFKKGEYRVLEKIEGKKLVGLEYEPLYRFFGKGRKDYRIYPADFVTFDEGTGVVHVAPGFGEEDTELGKKVGLSMIDSVNDEGKFVSQVKPWAGIYIKETDPLICEDLGKRQLLFREETIFHSYPYCYRCHTPLIYKAQKSWFIDVQKLKERLLANNKKINWVPHHFKYGRFKKGIETAPDWCISRTRYWATAMPVWRCESCGNLKVVGSIKEIEGLSGKKVTDLHRRSVDHITFKCDRCGGVARRVPEVLDCWLESGSMPYGERHYPFENKEDFQNSFPGDFIVEYTGQVRAWFYVMHVISTALFDSHCFKNVVVTGVMSGSDGRKMSKSYGNYPDPRATIEKYGGDSLRLYLMGGPLMLAGDTSAAFLEKGLEENVKSVLLVLWNTYRYFVTYAKNNNWSFTGEARVDQVKDILDQWILVRLEKFQRQVERNLDRYQIPPAVKAIKPFVNDLSTWYIRSCRERFASGDFEALTCLYTVLLRLVKILAPIIPFITEKIYQGLLSIDKKALISVHLCDFPKSKKLKKSQLKLSREMALVREISSQTHAIRKGEGIRLRQPLAQLTYKTVVRLTEDSESLLAREVNVHQVTWRKGNKKTVGVNLDTRLTEKLIEEGKTRDLAREIQALRKELGLDSSDKVTVISTFVPEGKWYDWVCQKTNATRIEKGKKLEIKVEDKGR